MGSIPCNLWDWAVCSDLPSWWVFVLGSGLAICFFIWQWNKQRIRRNSAKESFVFALEFIGKNIDYIEKTIENYYNNGEKQEDKETVEVENSRLKLSSEHMRFYLQISADTLDVEFVRDVDFLCAVLNNPPLSGELFRDKQRLDKIEKMKKTLFDGELKEAKIKADAKRRKRWLDQAGKILADAKQAEKKKNEISKTKS